MNDNIESSHFRFASEESGKTVFLIVTATPTEGRTWANWTFRTVTEAEFNSSTLDLLPENRAEIVKKVLSHGRGSGEDIISDYVKI